MKFSCTIYILIVVFVKNKDKFFVRCIAHFEESKIVHLSQKLNCLGCLQLVKSMYELTPASIEGETINYDVLQEGFNQLLTTSEECLAELEYWNNNFPRNGKSSGHPTMEVTLWWLGRPDSAKYERGNHRSLKYVDTENYDTADTLEFSGHKVSRRHAPKEVKHLSKNGKKKKKKKKKKTKKSPREHSQNSVKKHKGPQKAVTAATAHATAYKRRELSNTNNQSQHRKDYIEQHRSICCSILCVLFFIILCLVAVFFLHRRNRLKARGTRFKYNSAMKKENKDTLTDHLEWNNETVCSCSDVEDGCTGKCLMCGGDYQTYDTSSHRNGSHDSMKDLKSGCVQKTRKEKEKKGQRLNFLLRNFQDKKRRKDQRDRDRKCVKRKNPGKL